MSSRDGCRDQRRGNAQEVEAAVQRAVSALDRAAKIGAIHENAADRRKSRLMLKVNAALGGEHSRGACPGAQHEQGAGGQAGQARASRRRARAKAKGEQTAAGKARAALARSTRAASESGHESPASAAEPAAVEKPARRSSTVKTQAKAATKVAAGKAPAKATAKAPAKASAKGDQVGQRKGDQVGQHQGRAGGRQGVRRQGVAVKGEVTAPAGQPASCSSPGPGALPCSAIKATCVSKPPPLWNMMLPAVPIWRNGNAPSEINRQPSVSRRVASSAAQLTSPSRSTWLEVSWLMKATCRRRGRTGRQMPYGRGV